MTYALIAESVSRSYNGVRAVDNVSLTLPPGSVTALLGGSGAGKSTLLRLFAGLEPVDAGTIRAGERVLSALGRTVPAEARHVGLVFQDFALFPHLTVRRNIQFGLRSYSRAAAEQTVSTLLSEFGLLSRANAYPHELSGGEQQRVAIARAIAPGPSAILMDEPFSGLDPSLRESVRESALGVLRRIGMPVLMVTHDPAEALASADRIAIMKAGRLVQAGAAEDVYRRPVSAGAAVALGVVNRIESGQIPTGLTPEGMAVPPGHTLYIRPEGIKPDRASSVLADVTSRRLTGPLVRLELAIGDLRLNALAPPAVAPQAGARTGIRLDPDLAFIFPSGES